MSDYEVTRWHLSLPARVRVGPSQLPALQLLWLRIAGQPGGRRMTDIGEVMAHAKHLSPQKGHALAWTVYESLRSRQLADGSLEPREPLTFFPTEHGRVLVIEADREERLQRRTA